MFFQSLYIGRWTWRCHSIWEKWCRNRIIWRWSTRVLCTCCSDFRRRKLLANRRTITIQCSEIYCIIPSCIFIWFICSSIYGSHSEIQSSTKSYFSCTYIQIKASIFVASYSCIYNGSSTIQHCPYSDTRKIYTGIKINTLRCSEHSRTNSCSWCTCNPLSIESNI